MGGEKRVGMGVGGLRRERLWGWGKDGREYGFGDGWCLRNAFACFGWS